MAEEADSKGLEQEVIGVLTGGEKEKAEPQYVRIRWDKIKKFVPEKVGEDGFEDWLSNKMKTLRYTM